MSQHQKVVKPKICVIGIGDSGENAISKIVQENINDVAFVAVNMDRKEFALKKAKKKVQKEMAYRAITSSYLETGKVFAEEDMEKIKEIVKSSEVVFLIAGMGGVAGTKASPVIASIAKKMNILTIALVTMPFEFEGEERTRIAERGIQELIPNADAVIIIPNDRILKTVNRKIPVNEAFRLSNSMLNDVAKSICESFSTNKDFADIKTTFESIGVAWLGIGKGQGENKAIEAARAAAESPLLSAHLDSAAMVFYSIKGGEDLTLFEVDEATKVITKSISPDASLFFETIIDKILKDEIHILLIAGGFQDLT